MKSGSEKLAEAREAVLALAARREVGKRVREELGELAESVEQIRSRVAEIEGLYAIDFGSDIDSKIEEAEALWRDAPAERLRGPALLPIRRASPVLSTLFVKGIDIQSARKFSDSEIAFAQWIGTRFDMMSDLLRALRREKRSDKDPTEWSAIVPMRKSLKAALLDLERREVIDGRRMLVRNKEKRWTPFELRWLRDEPETELLLIYEKKDPALLQFMKGEWLNAYVYDIIDDQLMRHEVPYELYTDVSYRAPQDVIRAASEFDVIGRFRDTVVCVECKSGRLDFNRGDFDDLVQRTEAVRTVLSSMGEGETHFLFFVVYEPATNPEEEMRERLEPRSIRPLKPTEVRAVMASVLESSLA
ncbi:MAG TPA: hypothetical protein VEA60_13750 [Allosphingosinicella sp.]|nr:hypothetical protein [Allosphingosinicella sp.]